MSKKTFWGSITIVNDENSFSFFLPKFRKISNEWWMIIIFFSRTVQLLGDNSDNGNIRNPSVLSLLFTLLFDPIYYIHFVGMRKRNQFRKKWREKKELESCKNDGWNVGGINFFNSKYFVNIQRADRRHNIRRRNTPSEIILLYLNLL